MNFQLRFLVSILEAQLCEDGHTYLCVLSKSSLYDLPLTCLFLSLSCCLKFFSISSSWLLSYSFCASQFLIVSASFCRWSSYSFAISNSLSCRAWRACSETSSSALALSTLCWRSFLISSSDWSTMILVLSLSFSTVTSEN